MGNRYRDAAILVACAGFIAWVVPLRAQTTPAAPTIAWTKVTVDLPVSSELLPPGDGAPLANGYCLICHSAGMILRQPPLSEAQWRAEVVKMRTAFGGPIPPDSDATLAAYLARINNPAPGAAGTAPSARR